MPFYGVSLRRAGIKPGHPITDDAWARVPILGRRAVQEAGDRLHATELPPGHGRPVEVRTSGSSGMPVTVRKTELEQFYWQSFTLREELWHGRDLGAKLLAIRRDDQLAPTATGASLRQLRDWGAPVATVYPTGPMVLLDYRCTIAEQADALRRERPDYLLTFPSNLLALLRHMRAQDLAPAGLRGVRTAGEALAPETRALCSRPLGCVEVTDCYSAAETGNLAFQCPDSPPGQERYHVQSESALVEVLDADGRPCAPGATGRVVVTPLHNFAMPLIRYEIGDLAEVGPPCTCGRTLPVLTRIPGRARDMLTLPGGAQRHLLWPWRAGPRRRHRAAPDRAEEHRGDRDPPGCPPQADRGRAAPGPCRGGRGAGPSVPSYRSVARATKSPAAPAANMRNSPRRSWDAIAG